MLLTQHLFQKTRYTVTTIAAGVIAASLIPTQPAAATNPQEQELAPVSRSAKDLQPQPTVVTQKPIDCITISEPKPALCLRQGGDAVQVPPLKIELPLTPVNKGSVEILLPIDPGQIKIPIFTIKF